MSEAEVEKLIGILAKKRNEATVLMLAAIRIKHGEEAATGFAKEFFKNGKGNDSQEWTDKRVRLMWYWAKGVEEVARRRFPDLDSFGFDKLCDLLRDAEPPLFELVITDGKCDVCRSKTMRVEK